MSNLTHDIKSTIKGIRGAGDVLRGELMEATDKTVHKGSIDPAAAAAQQKHRAVTEKGERDMRGADEMLARKERAREANARAAVGAPSAPGGYNPTGSMGPPPAAAGTEAVGTTDSGAWPSRASAGAVGAERAGTGREFQSPVHTSGSTGYPQEPLRYPQETSRHPQEASHYPQEGSRYPQETSGYPQEASRYPQEASHRPQEASTYPQETSGHPQRAAGYPQESTRQGIPQSYGEPQTAAGYDSHAAANATGYPPAASGYTNTGSGGLTQADSGYREPQGSDNLRRGVGEEAVPQGYTNTSNVPGSVPGGQTMERPGGTQWR